MLFVRASARYWSQLLGRRREETLEAEPQVGGGHHLAKQLVAHFTTRYDPQKVMPKIPQNSQNYPQKLGGDGATGGGGHNLDQATGGTLH